MKNQTVAVNEFVLRQIKGSGKSYANELPFETMAHHAEERLNSPGDHIVPGYRNGVCLVAVEPSYVHHFYCPLVKIGPDTRLIAEIARRRKEEELYIQIRALNGNPLSAHRVDFILYRHDVLAENNEHSTDADWELICFNAIPESVDNMPMGPVTMMRNQLKLPGGTKAEYSSEKWAGSVKFWQEYAFLKE